MVVRLLPIKTIHIFTQRSVEIRGCYFIMFFYVYFSINTIIQIKNKTNKFSEDALN